MARLWTRFSTLTIPIALVLATFLIARLTLVKAVETTTSPAAQTALKVLQGELFTNTGVPVQNGLVTAHKVNHPTYVETLTDAAGRYELVLAPGLWAVTVAPTDSSRPANWVYPHEPQHIEFRPNGQPETLEQNFTVIVADATVLGVVTMPDGSVPPFTVTVALRNGEGYGARTLVDPGSGAFTLMVPHGRYDIIIHAGHDAYAGPHLEPIHLEPNAVLDLGRIALLTRNAWINGQVVDNHGAPVADMPIIAWQGDRPDALRTTTDEKGLYSLAVMSGTWHIQPAPAPDMPYLYLGEGTRVQIAAGETVNGIDFELLALDALITGVLTRPDGAIIADIAGWVRAINLNHPDIHNGAPIHNGAFRLPLAAGSYLLTIQLPPGSPFVAPDGIPATVASGETLSLTIPLRLKDATISGPLLDPRQDHQPVTGVNGTVSARSGDHWATTHIRPDAGTYSLAVTAGVWHLTYDIDDPDYVQLAGPANIPVQAGQTVNWPLLVTRKDAVLAGQVLAPDGSPVPGATIFAQGLTGDIHKLRLHGRADENGHFRLNVPHGRYRIGAVGGRDGWINPLEQVVAVGRDAAVAGLVLQFQAPNAAISGTLTVSNTLASGRTTVWAWSEHGGFTMGKFPVTQADPGGTAFGPYHLPVVAGAVWHVGAIFETDDAYWVGRSEVHVSVANTIAVLDLELRGPFTKPGPVVVTFNANQAQHLTLADGTEIFIPAGALPVDGRVTLRLIPLASLPGQRHAQVIQYGYAIFATDAAGFPIEAHFNHNVVIRFAYDQDRLFGHDHRIQPAYFSTTTNEWTRPEHYFIEPDRGLVTIEIDHFTNFALVQGLVPWEQFLPAIAH